jgi:hypothetical protein
MPDCINHSSENFTSGAETCELKKTSSVAQAYQERNAQLVAKLKQPKVIFTIQGWQVHSLDLQHVEESLAVILSGMVLQLRDEYNLIIGTTAKNPSQAANLYVLELKEKSFNTNNEDVSIEVRLEP